MIIFDFRQNIKTRSNLLVVPEAFIYIKQISETE